MPERRDLVRDNTREIGTEAGALNFRVDLEKINAMLDQNPRINVTMRVGDKDVTLIEAVRIKRGDLAADNTVNTLC